MTELCVNGKLRELYTYVIFVNVEIGIWQAECRAQLAERNKECCVKGGWTFADMSRVLLHWNATTTWIQLQ